MNAIQQAAREYVDHGWQLIALEHNSKGTDVPGWNLPGHAIDTPEKLVRINGGNVGLALAWTRTATIDVDDYAEAEAMLADVGIDLNALMCAKGAVQIRSRANRAKLVYRLPEGTAPPRSHAIKANGNATVYELRCATIDGKTVQDVLPPSIHPDTGKPYEWVGDWRNLPELPAHILAHWQALGVAGATVGEINIPNVNADDLAAGMALLNDEKLAIVEGGADDGRRSEAVYAVIAHMCWKDATDAQIIAVLTHPGNGISAKPLEKRRPAAWLMPQIAKKRAEVAAERAARGNVHIDFDTLTGKSGATGNANSTGGTETPGADSKGATGLEPIPLPKLPPVPEFPADILPDAFKAWVMDAADRARFDPAFMAASAMVGIGSLIGRKLGIRLKATDIDWIEFGNVWGCIVGTPSALKSPAMSDALRPVRALQANAAKDHVAAVRDWEADVEAHKMRRSADKKAAAKRLAEDRNADIGLNDSDAPEKPVGRCYWTSDATVERLGELAVENPNGLLIVRDELSSLLKSLEAEQNSEARGFYLSGWSGKEGYRFDRIMRGTTYSPAYALSMMGGIQPGPLSRFVRSAQSGEQADGLLQRLQLLVWPDGVEFEYVDRAPDRATKELAVAAFERADTFDGRAIGEVSPYFNDDPPFIGFDPAAQELFVDWYSQFMQSRRAIEKSSTEAGPLAAHFGKYPGLLGKLAIIMHVCDDPEGRAVSRRSLLKALAWLDYLDPHARRVYHAAHSPETQAAELLIARIRGGKLPAQFKSWEIVRNGWHGLTDKEGVKRACRLLFEHRWFIEIDVGDTGKMGRPNDPVYAVNPATEGQ
jgi:hypothetical protein